ncbi:MAG: flagellar biosynthetic protein FliO [Lachnospiraceae bacterium]|nr:flagellar biosynthetic protein FliO [Lachnospiraceae bacterium]
MTIFLTGIGNSFLKLLAALVIFVGVLLFTAVVTRWMANYQKGMLVNSNIEIVETSRLANNKFIQIVRIGGKYMAIAVCKDTVTVLCEIPEEELKTAPGMGKGVPDFKSMLNKFIKKEQEQSGISEHVEEPREEVNE